MTLTPAQVKALCAAEKADASASMDGSDLSKERERANEYYLGDMSSDMPRAAGRSGVISTDVADTIEGLMPSLMEIFCGGDKVVEFEPVGPEDVEAAEQETDFVNHVFMQKNPGFLITYSFIKDALLSKNGIVKVAHEEGETEERETFLDQPDDVFALLAADEGIEIVEHTDHGNGLHDVTVAVRKGYGCPKVYNVPPEEFGIEKGARSIRDANYAFHDTAKTEAELIAQGFDAAQIKKLTPKGAALSSEESSRNTVEDDQGSGGERNNKPARRLTVLEEYIRMDFREDGKPSLYRVTRGGQEGDVLIRKGGGPAIDPVDAIPFAAMTPVIMTHRFWGRSIADLVMDIQRIKTSLLRVMLDNGHLANNPRTIVAESLAGPKTLDDILSSRIGGVIRTKAPGAVEVIKHPTIAGEIFPMVEYFDATREWRTGVTRQGQGIDANALQNQSATAVNQMFTAAQARMKLIARIFAETGFRDLFSLLHGVIRKNPGHMQGTFRLKGSWVPVDPRNWKSRDDMTINVGLGDGGKQQQAALLLQLIGLQKEAMAIGLAEPKHLFNAAERFVRLSGIGKNAETFFAKPDPNAPPPAPPPDPKLIEIEKRMELEGVQAKADMEAQSLKTEAEIALADRKFALERELKLLEARIEIAKAEREDERAASRDERDIAREDRGERRELVKHGLKERETADGGREVVSSEDMRAERFEQMLAGFSEALNNLAKAHSAPKRIVRGPDGRASHTETVL